MSIELKQAAQQALEAFDTFGEADDFASLFALNQKMNALRTAIQQPATPEPVAQWQKRHPIRTAGRWISTDEHDAKWWSEHSRGWEVRALYTHPAPSVLADVVRDAERYRWLAGYCRSTSEHWGGRWSIIIDGPAPKTHDSEDDLDAAIDAAMLAAKDSK